MVAEMEQFLSRHRQTADLGKNLDQIREGLAEIFAKYDPEPEWGKIIKVEEHPDREPGVWLVSYNFEEEHEIPQWFRDHLSGFTKDI